MSENKIFWFSGSGNSLALAKLLNKKIENSELVQMHLKNFDYKLGANVKNVYFVFPIHAWRPPYIVVNFIKSMNFGNVKNIYALATAGGEISDSFYYLDKVLNKKGLSLKSGLSIKMPDNCIYLYNPSVNSEANQKIMQDVDAYLEANLNLDSLKSEYKRASFLSSLIFTKIIGWVFYKTLRNFNRKFYATEECSSCGICTRICPNFNISLDEENRRPVWGGTCTACMACIHLCPEKAINYGKKTLKRNRYVCPTMKVKDFFI